tara:strand:- start:279 stop:674 length:396 start_codon:yes stop_codon:yes gene_type:complete
MSNDYNYYLKQFHSEAKLEGDIPVELPNGEEFKVSIQTDNNFGLETLDAVGLYEQFEFNWENYYGDFVMSGIHGKTRYIWAVLKQDGDCGIVTFHMDKSQNKLAQYLLKDMAKLIEAQHISTNHIQTTGEA